MFIEFLCLYWRKIFCTKNGLSLEIMYIEELYSLFQYLNFDVVCENLCKNIKIKNLF